MVDLILKVSNIFVVVGLYSKTGGKNGKHGSVSESSNISAISYMAVQAFEHIQFCSVPAATAIFQTRQFLLLSSMHFLTLLDYKLNPLRVSNEALIGYSIHSSVRYLLAIHFALALHFAGSLYVI